MTNGIKNLNDLAEELIQHEAQLAQQVRVEDGDLIIDVEYEYVIELSRCDSMPKILAWVAHLCEKTWMTNDVMERFIQMACQQHGLQLPQP